MLSCGCGNKIKFFYVKSNRLAIHSYLYILMALIRYTLKQLKNTRPTIPPLNHVKV